MSGIPASVLADRALFARACGTAALIRPSPGPCPVCPGVASPGAVADMACWASLAGGRRAPAERAAWLWAASAVLPCARRVYDACGPGAAAHLVVSVPLPGGGCERVADPRGLVRALSLWVLHLSSDRAVAEAVLALEVLGT